jgi:outer membrane receptor protein involved in Fe transport
MRHLISGAFTLAGLTDAFAQSPQAPSAATTAPAAGSPTQSVEVLGNREQYDARRDDTATKIVVNQAELEKFGDTNLADVLKRQPGITIGSGRGGGEIRMRGLGAGYTQVLVNGQAAPPGFTLDSLPPSQVERIEILRAATAELSTQSIAGTVNIILKSKVTAGERKLSVNAEGSNNFRSVLSTFQRSEKGKRFSYLFTGTVRVAELDQDSVQTDEEFDSAGRQTVLRRANKFSEGRLTNLTLTPRLLWNLQNGDTVSSQTFLTVERTRGTLSTGWLTEQGPPPGYAREFVRLDDKADQLRSDLGWVHKTAGGGKLDTKVTVSASRRTDGLRQQGYRNDAVEILDRESDVESRDHGITWVGKYSTPIGDNHAMAFGWDGGRSRRTQESLRRDRPIQGYVPVYFDDDYNARLDRLALFMQDEWNVRKNWSVYLGMRWETLRVESEGAGFNTISNRSNVLSPVLQTLWKFPSNPNEQLRFALTRTYRAPGLNRLIPGNALNINNSPVQPDPRGNPNLKPELATGVDLAWERFFGGGAMAGVSAYARRITDFTRPEVRLEGGRWVSMPINDGDARTHGIALEAKLPLRLLYKQAPALDLRANLARDWSSVDHVPGPHNRLNNQTPLSANVGLDYTMSPAFNMGGNFTFRTGGPVRVSENTSSYSTVKRELDFYGLLKLSPRTRVRVTAVNVLRQPHTTADQYTDARGRRQTSTEVPSSAVLRVTLELSI